MNFQDKIMKLAGTYLKDLIEIMPCTVNSVDQGNRVCDCIPIGGDAATQIPSVQLCAENDNGLLVFPSVGSTVLVGLSTRNTAFVIMYSAIDSVQFMDGSLGGMTKTLTLLQKVNNLENLINDLISKYNSHTHILTLTSGTGTAAPTLTQETTVLTPTTQNEIENQLITQGV